MNDSANRLVTAAVATVRCRWLQMKYTFPIDVARELQCTWAEASLALSLAEARCMPIAKRDDGRWYYDQRRVPKVEGHT